MEQLTHVSVLIIEANLDKKPEEQGIDYYIDLGYSVHKNRGEGRGKPDLSILKDGEVKFFVEVKSNDDIIAPHQFEWFITHKEKPIIIFYIKYDKTLINLRKRIKMVLKYRPKDISELREDINKMPDIIKLLKSSERNKLLN